MSDRVVVKNMTLRKLGLMEVLSMLFREHKRSNDEVSLKLFKTEVGTASEEDCSIPETGVR